MDQANVPPNPVKSKWSLAIAVIVTLNIVVRVVQRWHALDVLLRLDAIVLIVALVGVPIGLVRAERKERPLEPYQLLTFAYMAVLLTMLTFTLP